MAKFLLLCFLLVNTLNGQAMATNKPQITLQSIASSFSDPPADSPSSGQETYTTKPSIGRKLGKHHHKHVNTFGTPSPSPSEAPKSYQNINSTSEESIPSHQRTSVEPHDEVLGSQGQVHMLKQHHHSHDKSIAGGGVILGGLATTFLVSVYCYIRATRRHKLETAV